MTEIFTIQHSTKQNRNRYILVRQLTRGGAGRQWRNSSRPRLVQMRIESEREDRGEKGEEGLLDIVILLVYRVIVVVTQYSWKKNKGASTQQLYIPLIKWQSHSGLERSNGPENKSLIRSSSCFLLPGAGKSCTIMWFFTSKLVSSTHLVVRRNGSPTTHWR